MRGAAALTSTRSPICQSPSAATRRALAAGLALGLARSVGEVGITLMLGGNVEGRTTTVSLAIYNAVMGGEFAQAALLSALLGAVALAVFAALRRLEAL
jgi:molybdate transport system permease protein